MIYATLYHSMAAPGLSPAILARIETAAQQFNALDGITGCLWFDGRNFVQWLEGGEAAVEALISRLALDPRHHHIDILFRGFADENRFFPDWAMHLRRLDAPTGPEAEAALARLPAALNRMARDRLLVTG